MTDLDPRVSDVKSIDNIIAALYESISFVAGDEPDWERLRSLFLPGGMLVPPKDPDSDYPVCYDVDGFIERARSRIEENEMLQARGFVEKELARHTDGYANIAQVFSTYEGRFADGDVQPFARGVNSVQLLFESGRWWVVSIFWVDETPDTPIPPQYLDND